MAFDEISREQRRCPCGSGIYLIVRRMDDWNRTDETWTMECSRCANGYTLFTRPSHESGIPCAIVRWAPNELLPAVDELRERLIERQRFIAHLIDTRYRERIHDRMKGMSRKAVWALVQHEGGYPALQTFYKHVRDSGLAVTLDTHLNSSDGPAFVARVFGETDPDLSAATRDIPVLERELEARRDEVFRKSFV